MDDLAHLVLLLPAVTEVTGAGLLGSRVRGLQGLDTASLQHA